LALFSEALTIALSTLFGFVLILILRYYDQIRIVSDEYEMAKETLSTVILSFDNRLQKTSERLEYLRREIALLKTTSAKREENMNYEKLITEPT